MVYANARQASEADALLEPTETWAFAQCGSFPFVIVGGYNRDPGPVLGRWQNGTAMWAPIAGPWQSSTRAELVGLVLGRCIRRPIHVGIDNKTVVDKANAANMKAKKVQDDKEQKLVGPRVRLQMMMTTMSDCHSVFK